MYYRLPVYLKTIPDPVPPPVAPRSPRHLLNLLKQLHQLAVTLPPCSTAPGTACSANKSQPDATLPPPPPAKYPLTPYDVKLENNRTWTSEATRTLHDDRPHQLPDPPHHHGLPDAIADPPPPVYCRSLYRRQNLLEAEAPVEHLYQYHHRRTTCNSCGIRLLRTKVQ